MAKGKKLSELEKKSKHTIDSAKKDLLAPLSKAMLLNGRSLQTTAVESWKPFAKTGITLAVFYERSRSRRYHQNTWASEQLLLDTP